MVTVARNEHNEQHDEQHAEQEGERGQVVPAAGSLLDELAREGAQRMLAAALQAEVARGAVEGPRRHCSAGGAEKAVAIAAAVRAGLVHRIIIDTGAARELKRLA